MSAKRQNHPRIPARELNPGLKVCSPQAQLKADMAYNFSGYAFLTLPFLRGEYDKNAISWLSICSNPLSAACSVPSQLPLKTLSMLSVLLCSQSSHTLRKNVLPSTIFWCFSLSQIEDSIQYLTKWYLEAPWQAYWVSSCAYRYRLVLPGTE